MKEWARAAATAKPESLIFISPHAPFLPKALGWLDGRELMGSFAGFGAPGVSFRMSNNLDLAKSIAAEASRDGVPVVELASSNLDHGVMVPLYYLREAGVSSSLVVFGISMLPAAQLYRFGQGLARSVEMSPRRIGLIASGDLSHRLLPGAPAGYDPQGRVFDRLIEEALRNMDSERILNIPELLADRAGECGLRPIIMLLGALSDYHVESKIYSYEGPFGVGYLVAGFSLKGLQDKPLAIEASQGGSEGNG